MEAHMPDVSTEEFEALRPRLFGIAYRMTGSVGDAEDACQDAWLRWRESTAPPSTTPRRTSCGWSPGSPSTGCSRRSTGARPTSVPTCPNRWWPTTPRPTGGGGRAGRLAHARLPRAARRAHAEGPRGAVAARRVRLRLRRDRDDGRPHTRGVPAGGEPHPSQARPRAPRRSGAPTRRASTSSSATCSRPSPAVTSMPSWRCSRRDVVLLSDGGAERHAAAATRRRCRPRRALRREPGPTEAADCGDAHRADERRAGRALPRRRSTRLHAVVLVHTRRARAALLQPAQSGEVASPALSAASATRSGSGSTTAGRPRRYALNPTNPSAQAIWPNHHAPKGW